MKTFFLPRMSDAARGRKSSHLPSPEQTMSDDRQEISDDDLMTPPTVLLEKALEEAKRAASQKEARFLSKPISIFCEMSLHCAITPFMMYSLPFQAEAVVRLWVKCLTLTRIVHGNAHWELARCHIQLAKAYLDLHSKYVYTAPCVHVWQNQLNNVPP